LVVAVGEFEQLPGCVVADHVVVSAEWPEVVVVGWSALGEGFAVIEVAVVGRLAASGEDTGGVEGLEVAAL
jgi:hypothetical protein